MIRVRVAMIGTGVPDDPFRVDLPTYVMRAADYPNTRAIVSIPYEDVSEILTPAQIAAHDDSMNSTGVQALTPAQRRLWRELLMRRYGMISAVASADVV